MAQTITVNGKNYDFDQLDEQARALVINVRGAELRIRQLKQDLAITRTARAAYGRALAAQLADK